MKYKSVKLGEYLYIKGRIGWKGLKKKEYLSYSNYRIINGESLTDDGIDWSKAGYITKERYGESPEIMLQEGDILVSKDGTIGKIGYITSLDAPTTVASGIFVIRNLMSDSPCVYSRRRENASGRTRSRMRYSGSNFNPFRYALRRTSPPKYTR